MPRRCTVCVHADRAAIDVALVDGAPLRNVAEQFRLTPTSLHRHKAAHLLTDLVEAHAAGEGVRRETLVDQVQALRDRTLGILDKAEAADDPRVALAAVREARACVELLAKVAAPERTIRSAEDLTPEERQAIVRSVFPNGMPGAVLDDVARTNGRGDGRP